MFFIRIFFFLFILISCDSPHRTGPQVSTTLILVRHAEKIEDGSKNPELTETGKNRAHLLSNILANTEIDAIYSTPFIRNLQTVTPLAQRLTQEIKKYDPSLDLTLFLTDVLEKNKGKKIVICGHSNTIPLMLNILEGTDRRPYLEHQEYNHLYVVTVSEMGKAIVTDLAFQPSP